MTPKERHNLKVEIIKELIFEFLQLILKNNRRCISNETSNDFQREGEGDSIRLSNVLSDKDIIDLKAIAELFVRKVSDRDSSTERDNAIYELYKGIEKRYNMEEGIMQDAITEIFYVFNLYGWALISLLIFNGLNHLN